MTSLLDRLPHQTNRSCSQIQIDEKPRETCWRAIKRQPKISLFAAMIVMGILFLGFGSASAQTSRVEVIGLLDAQPYLPNAGLVQGLDGAFYGTSETGGADNAGTVFRVTTNGLLTTLVSFNRTNES